MTIDLDAAQDAYDRSGPGELAEAVAYVPALVAALRAALEVVGVSRMWSAPENAVLMPYAAQRDLAEAVAAYDQTVGGGS